MIIQISQFNAIFKRISDIRRKVFDLEDQLKEHFSVPFVAFPIPDDAPPEIPRFETKSLNNHSIIQVSSVNAQLMINFDSIFQNDWSKCSTYISKRINNLYSAIAPLVDNKFSFAGLTTQILFDDIEDPIKTITTLFNKVESNIVPFDIQGKYTFVIDNTFYVNISFTNARLFEHNPANDTIKAELPGMYKNQKYHKLAIILDINDRYGFNYNENYNSPPDVIERILNIQNDMISGKLEDFVKRGVLKL